MPRKHASPVLPTAGREDYEAHTPLPPNATADFAQWGVLLAKWNARINLVAPGTLGDFWTRHALDSAQVVPHIPDAARRIVDFGSGAGFPALAVAIDAKHRGLGRQVHLIESAGKKASFLRTVVRDLALPAKIHSARIEALEPLEADVITARAFAPLERLLPLAVRHLAPGGEMVLLKGERLEEEAEAARSLGITFAMTEVPSLSDSSGRILRITDLAVP